MSDYDEPDELYDEPDAIERRQRRESLMQRRLRRARGEEVDDEPEVYERVPRYERDWSGPAYAPGYGGGCANSLLYLVVGGVVVAMIALLFGRQLVASLTPDIPTEIRQIVATPTATILDRGGTIRHIQSLNRLETQRFSVERVVESSVERGNLLDTVLGERLLLIASGDVVAGVDLSKLTEADVEISDDGTSITLRLPPSEIFSASLNNERTRVYDRETRILTQLTGGENPELETLARQEADRMILAAACESGIMQRAADDARRAMEQFLGLLDFSSVTVEVTAGACVAPAQP